VFCVAAVFSVNKDLYKIEALCEHDREGGYSGGAEVSGGNMSDTGCCEGAYIRQSAGRDPWSCESRAPTDTLRHVVSTHARTCGLSRYTAISATYGVLLVTQL